MPQSYFATQLGIFGRAMFENVIFCPKMTAENALVAWIETKEIKPSRKKSTLSTDTTRWFPPPIGITKLNTDIAVLQNGLVGIGFILRDDSGKALRSGNRRIKANGSSTLLEALTLRFALQILKDQTWPAANPD